MIQPKLLKLPLAALSTAAFSLGPALVAEEGKFLFINADPDPVQITLTIEKARPGHRRSRSGSFDRSIRAGWGAPDKVHPVSFQVPLDERPVTVDPGDPVTLYVPDCKPNHLFQVVSSTRKDQKRLCSLQTRGGHTVLTIPDHENRPIQRVDQVCFSFGDLDKASRAGLPSLGADSPRPPHGGRGTFARETTARTAIRTRQPASYQRHRRSGICVHRETRRRAP